MPAQLQNNGYDHEGGSPSTQGRRASMVHEAYPDRVSRGRGRLVMMCSLVVFLIILYSSQQLGGGPSLIPASAAAQTYQGFGASTPGGQGKPTYRVKTLSNSGPGSLRDAISQSNRSVVFDVGGEIRHVSRRVKTATVSGI
jgi:hypothetical protein